MRPYSFVPGKSGFISAAGIEGGHIGVKAGDDLNHGEAFGGAVGGEFLKVDRPLESLTETHPPGVGEPEERRSILVLEVTPVANRRAARRGAPAG